MADRCTYPHHHCTCFDILTYRLKEIYMKIITPENNKEACDTIISAVAWPSIIAGAFTAAAMSLILIFLGSGLGLASISPWSNSGIAFTTFTIASGIWLIIMQFVSSGLGGYLTGRLRRRWVSIDSDEVFFRDTAHGFLAWALATIITAALLASVASSVIGGGVKAVTTVTAISAAGAGYGAAQNSDGSMEDMTGYFIDSLFRSNQSAQLEGDTRDETMRLLITNMQGDTVSNTDKAYLTQLVSAQTGLSSAESARRVNDIFAKLTAAKENAQTEIDNARNVAMQIALYTFLSLLIGAFIASYAAVLGGRDRDKY